MRHLDRAIGIVLGLLLGIAIVIVFVFFGSGETIDDPDLSGDDVPAREREEAQPARPAPGQP